MEIANVVIGNFYKLTSFKTRLTSCNSGDTSFEIHDLPNKLSEVWTKTCRYFSRGDGAGDSSSAEEDFDDEE